MDYHSELTGSINKQLSKKELDWISEKWKHGLNFIKPDSDILDIGCADGSFFDFIKNNNINFTGNLSCFDVDKKALEVAKKRGIPHTRI